MRSILIAMILAGTVYAPVQAAASLDANIKATADDQVRELLSEGVKLFRIGRYDEAALRLKDALLLQPENKLVYEFYLKMGDNLLGQLRDRAELEDVMDEILRKARVYQQELRRDPRYIELLIAKLRTSERHRLAATNELIAIGPIAVPQLMQKLTDTRQDDYRVWSRMVLARMGYRAVLPLLEALNTSDDRQAQSIATVLADIADPRALPKLQEIQQREVGAETLKRVARNAIASIAARSGIVDIADAPQLYFQEALRYFRDGDQVRDELVANESLRWRWVESVGEGEYQLQYEIVPSYAWNELMAEELIFDGLAVDPSFEGFYPLGAATLAAQEVEANTRFEIAQDRTSPARTPDASLDAITARQQALAEINDRVKMFGPAAIYRGIQQSIVSERYDTAIYLMNLLRDPYLAHAEQMLPDKLKGFDSSMPGTVLVAALSVPEKRIRYHAAITLAHLDPQLQFFNAEQVMPLLADAVGEWGMLAVLVVEPDFRHRNTARHQLMEQGLLAFTANDGFQAMQRLNAAPFKDAVIIAGDLTPALRDEHGVIIDVPEQTPLGIISLLKQNRTTAAVPVFISLPDNKELSLKVRATFETATVEIDGEKVKAITGFVARPYSGVEMKGRIEAALGDTELPQVNRRQREAISLAAAEAIGAVDPVKTQFDMTQTTEALLSTIANRADPIRIAALRALGQTGQSERINKVTEVYESQLDTLAGKPAVRAAFLYAIGLLNPTTESAQSIIAEALTAEELEVRQAAAEALGHSHTLTYPDRYQHILQQRMDVRGAGNGLESN